MQVFTVIKNSIDNLYRVVDVNDVDGTAFGGAYDNVADAVASAYDYLSAFDGDFAICNNADAFEVKTCKPAGNSSHIRTPSSWIGSEVYIARKDY